MTWSCVFGHTRADLVIRSSSPTDIKLKVLFKSMPPASASSQAVKIFKKEEIQEGE